MWFESVARRTTPGLVPDRFQNDGMGIDIKRLIAAAVGLAAGDEAFAVVLDEFRAAKFKALSIDVIIQGQPGG